MIYLDNAATTGKKPYTVKNAVLKELEECANPGRSSHKAGIRAQNKIYETREALCSLFKTGNPENFILTPNATYGLNFAIKGILKPFDHCITTSMEHNSVLRPLYSLKKTELTIVKGDKYGFVSPEEILKNVKANTRLIVINHSSNVNGTIQNIEKTVKLLKPLNIPILIDASQSAGIIDINWENFSLIAFPGHKGLYGPQGTGGLYIKDGINLETIIEGGTGSESKLAYNPSYYPDRLESGTLNTPGISGLCEGIKFVLAHGIKNILEYEHYLCSKILDALLNMTNVKVYSPPDINSITNSIAFNIDSLDSTRVAEILDTSFDIAVRPGFHCAPLAHRTLDTENSGSVRVSVSYFNRISEIKAFIDAVYKISAHYN